MTSRGDWVRVECIDELDGGTAIKFIDCAICKRDVCLGAVLGPPELSRIRGGVRMVRVTVCAAWSRNPVIYEDGVPLGRTYRLVLPPEATDDAEAVTRERELVR